MHQYENAFWKNGLTEPPPQTPPPSVLYDIYHTKMNKQTSSTWKKIWAPQQIFLVAPLYECGETRGFSLSLCSID